MPTTLNTTASNAISQMFRDIANKIPGYIWGTTSSGAPNISSVRTGLHNVGYSQAKYIQYDFLTAYNSIADWYPVLLVGYQQYGGGHIWIADGYYEQTWQYTKKKKILGITVSTETWLEYMDTFYMNWGWDGNGNGWVDQEDWSSGGFNYSKYVFYYLYPKTLSLYLKNNVL